MNRKLPKGLPRKIADRATYFLSSKFLRTRLLAIEALDFSVRVLSIETLDEMQQPTSEQQPPVGTDKLE